MPQFSRVDVSAGPIVSLNRSPRESIRVVEIAAPAGQTHLHMFPGPQQEPLSAATRRTGRVEDSPGMHTAFALA